jgi:hypothetical protein
MFNLDEAALPATGPHGERVTYGNARSYARSILDREAATDDERALAKTILALIRATEQRVPPTFWRE